MTPDELAQVEERHQSVDDGQDGQVCWVCWQNWPCDTREVLDELRGCVDVSELILATDNAADLATEMERQRIAREVEAIGWVIPAGLTGKFIDRERVLEAIGSKP